MLSKLKQIYTNRYVRFAVVAIIYLLWFVIWAQNLWYLLGLIVIYDVYVSKKMYQIFGRKHKENKGNSIVYRKTAEWVEAIVFATVVASVIRIFFFEMYVIPSSSMEKTLLVGDYLCVSKVAYGPKMPNTPIAFPFVHHTMPFSATKKSFSEIIQRPYKRLRGFRDIKQGDIVIFNYPAGDTVMLEDQVTSYYDLLRIYKKQYSDVYGQYKIANDFTLVSRPVDKRENYIKRLIAMPGDSLEIKHSVVYLNSQALEESETLQFNYFVHSSEPIAQSVFESLNILPEEIRYYSRSQAYLMPLTKQGVKVMEQQKGVTKVNRQEATKSSYEIFPKTNNGWNEDNFGPLWIPKKGATVELTLENLPIYQRVITTYEGNTLEVKDEEIFINKQKATDYTFQMDYYFMMGDNRHNSADSRYWGFVPEDHIVGTPSFVWLSLDKDKSFPSNIRWNKIFRNID